MLRRYYGLLRRTFAIALVLYFRRALIRRLSYDPARCVYERSVSEYSPNANHLTRGCQWLRVVTENRQRAVRTNQTLNVFRAARLCVLFWVEQGAEHRGEEIIGGERV
jgi:hypothetical protein